MVAVKSVAVVESMPVFLEGLRSVILKAGFTLAFCAKGLDSISEDELRLEPSLILLSCSCAEITRHLSDVQRIRELLPATKLVLIVDSITADETLQLWRLIDGFVLRTIDVQALPKALEVVLLGERVMPGIPREITINGALHAGLSVPTDLPHLSPREQDVLRSLSCGSSNKLIARTMGLSEATVKVHVKGILRKLNVRNRTEAAVWARTHGFSPLQPL